MWLTTFKEEEETLIEHFLTLQIDVDKGACQMDRLAVQDLSNFSDRARELNFRYIVQKNLKKNLILSKILSYDPNASYWLLNFLKSCFLSAGSYSHKNVLIRKSSKFYSRISNKLE